MSTKSSSSKTSTTKIISSTSFTSKDKTPSPTLPKAEKLSKAPSIPMEKNLNTKSTEKIVADKTSPIGVKSSPTSTYNQKNEICSPPKQSSPPKKGNGTATKTTGLTIGPVGFEKTIRPTSGIFTDKAMPLPMERSAPINVMVTGANRGIGLSMVQEFLNNRDIKRVIATTRKTEDATDMKKRITDSRLIVVTMDVTDDESVEKAYDSVAGILEKEGLTLLVNNAGAQILYNVREKPKRADLLRQLDVNTIGPIIVTQIFLPLLLKAAENYPTDALSINRAAVINISDTLASIALNNADQIVQNPLRLAYRMSKTALNSASRTLSLDLVKDGILVVAIDPGSVQTEMGIQMSELTLEESMSQLIPTIYGLRAKHNGGFIQRDGKPIVF